MEATCLAMAWKLIKDGLIKGGPHDDRYIRFRAIVMRVITLLDCIP